MISWAHSGDSHFTNGYTLITSVSNPFAHSPISTVTSIKGAHLRWSGAIKGPSGGPDSNENGFPRKCRPREEPPLRLKRMKKTRMEWRPRVHTRGLSDGQYSGGWQHLLSCNAFWPHDQMGLSHTWAEQSMFPLLTFLTPFAGFRISKIKLKIKNS